MPTEKKSNNVDFSKEEMEKLGITEETINELSFGKGEDEEDEQ